MQQNQGIFFTFATLIRKREKLNKVLINRLYDLLAGPQKKISIVMHTNPDGDAVGSALGLYSVLKNLGHQNVNVTAPNAYASFLHWMPGHKQVIVAEQDMEKATETILFTQVLFCLDFNDFSRAEPLEKPLAKSRATKVMIDHHPNPGKGFDITISDTSVSSTAELLYETLSALGYEDKINLDAAQCLYAGIVTDTGSFSFACNNPRTYEITAKLIRLGVDGAALQRLIYNTFTENRMRLLGYCLGEKLKVFADNKAAYISLSKDELARFHHKEGDTEGFVNYALSIRGIRLAAIFMEREDHVKVSLRSIGDLDVNKFAGKYFNGGGHKNAAGGKSNKDLEQTTAYFEELINSKSDFNK